MPQRTYSLFLSGARKEWIARRSASQLGRLGSRLLWDGSFHTSSSNNHRCRFPRTFCSSVDTTADATESVTAARTVTPRPLFPWRHETTFIPRLTPGTPEFAASVIMTPGGHAMIRGIFLYNQNTNLLLRIISSFGSTHWRQELADTAGWAFLQGVAGIVSNTYRLPMDDVAVVKDDIPKVTFTFPPSSEEEDGAVKEKKSDNTEQKTETSGGSHHESNSDPPTENSMIHSNLQKLYQSAHASGRDQLRIRLQIEPTGRCILYNLFCLPFVSRTMVERDPILRDLLKELIIDGRFTPHFPTTNAIYQHIFGEDDDFKTATTTVEMQVLIECDEIFQVLDASSGVVVQGSSDGAVRRVWHMARFETDVITSGRFFVSNPKVQNWQLTDIDDLLGPTTWYQTKTDKP